MGELSSGVVPESCGGFSEELVLAASVLLSVIALLAFSEPPPEELSVVRSEGYAHSPARCVTVIRRKMPMYARTRATTRMSVVLTPFFSRFVHS